MTETSEPKVRASHSLPPKATVSHFYKYSSLASVEQLERLRIIIQEHQLYLPNLDQLNDPAEGRPRLEILSEEQMSDFLLSKFAERNPQLTAAELDHERKIIEYNVTRHGAQNLQRSLAETFYSELRGYRVYSMSKRWDNLSLWAKYAGEHSGYCLEFVNDGPLFERARDVIYEDTFRMDVNNPLHTDGYWFFFKRPEWSNEEEIRLVLPRGNGSKVKIAPSWLNRLILGKNVSADNEKAVLSWAQQREPHLSVEKARYDLVEQRLLLTALTAS